VRTVQIARGECDVFVERYTKPCPLCHTLVREGEFHRCRIEDTPQKRQPIRQPHKDAK
jgi:hypothetical protein